MEGKPHDWQFDRKEFWEWLTSRFQLHGADNIGDTTIVSSFSAVRWTRSTAISLCLTNFCNRCLLEVSPIIPRQTGKRQSIIRASFQRL
jgi:hypothetical protein